MRTLSQTVSSARMPRPSGTWATPRRAIHSGERRARERPSRWMWPLRRRLAGAVRAEDGDDLALVDDERDAVERLDVAVAGAHVLELKERRHQVRRPRDGTARCCRGWSRDTPRR